MRATVICDGRGNAGTGARAAVLYGENGKMIDQKGEKIEPTTNIVAEHLSIQLGIELALKHGVTDLLIINDSQTPVNHVKGDYKVRQDNLKPIVEKTWELASQLEAVEIQWRPRSETTVADRLCRLVDKPLAKRSRPGGRPPAAPTRSNPFAPQES